MPSETFLQYVNNLPAATTPLAGSEQAYVVQGGVSKRAPISAISPAPAAASVNWINVKNAPYNATGNGSTDDTTAINAAIAAFNTAGKGVLYFPAGTYLTSAALTAITAIGIIQGDGETNLNFDAGLTIQTGTLITCTSSSAALFTINSQTLTIRDISLQNTSGITPTAGAGILVTNATASNQKVDYRNIQVQGFFNDVDIREGACWVMDNAIILDPVQHGISIQNAVNNDAGDWSISNSTISCQLARSPTGDAIHQTSSGGSKIVNLKINGNAPAPGGGKFVNGLNINLITSSILLIVNTSIENYSGKAIIVTHTNLAILSNVEIAHVANTTNPACSFDQCSGVIVSGLFGIQTGGGSPALTNFNTTCSNVFVASIHATSGFTGGVITGLASAQNINGFVCPITGFTDVATLRAVTGGPAGCRYIVNNTSQASPTLGQLVAAGDAGGTNTQPVFLDGSNTWRYG